MTNNQEKLKVFILEDNPGDVFLIKFYLEELDPDFYEITNVATLAEAHKRLEFEEFDVVLLDLHVPDSQGMETLTKSVKKFPNQIFIVMTGLSDESIGVEAVKNGAQDFLVKGRFDSKVLDSAIKFASQRSQMRHKIGKYLEILNTIGEINHFATFIVNKKKNLFEYSSNFIPSLKLDKELNYLEDFLAYIQNKETLTSSIESLEESESKILELKIQERVFQAKIFKGIHGTIGTISYRNES